MSSEPLRPNYIFAKILHFAVTSQHLSIAAKEAGTPTSASDWMIAAANPLAVEAGAAILRDGGAAADAMVAVQAVLGLAEPQSSGLGGPF